MPFGPEHKSSFVESLTRQCNCRVCDRHDQFIKDLEKIPEEHRAFVQDLYDQLVDVEMDLNYYQCIVNGSWPNADEVIKSYRSFGG